MFIGLVGTKGSGKSTVATMLHDEFGMTEYTVATPLKQICKVLGAPDHSIYGTQEEKESLIPHIGMSGRHLMQKLGTDLFRETFHKVLPEFNLGGFSIWVYLLDKFLRDNTNVVVSDIRFNDEAGVITKHGGVLIRILRDTHAVDMHISEQEPESIPCMHTIDNTGSLDDLRGRVKELVKSLKIDIRKH